MNGTATGKAVGSLRLSGPETQLAELRRCWCEKEKGRVTFTGGRVIEPQKEFLKDCRANF